MGVSCRHNWTRFYYLVEWIRSIRYKYVQRYHMWNNGKRHLTKLKIKDKTSEKLRRLNEDAILAENWKLKKEKSKSM